MVTWNFSCFCFRTDYSYVLGCLLPNSWLLIISIRYNNKTYKIDDISWEEHPTDSFSKKDGSSITFKEYYTQMYNYTPTDDKQPLLISNPKKKVGAFIKLQNTFFIIQAIDLQSR